MWAGYRPKLNAMARGSCQPDIREDTETFHLSGAPQGVVSVSLQARLVPQAVCAQTITGLAFVYRNAFMSLELSCLMEY